MGLQYVEKLPTHVKPMSFFFSKNRRELTKKDIVFTVFPRSVLYLLLLTKTCWSFCVPFHVLIAATKIGLRSPKSIAAFWNRNTQPECILSYLSYIFRVKPADGIARPRVSVSFSINPLNKYSSRLEVLISWKWSFAMHCDGFQIWRTYGQSPSGFRGRHFWMQTLRGLGSDYFCLFFFTWYREIVSLFVWRE